MQDGQEQIDSSLANQMRTLFKPNSWLAKIDFINHLVLLNNVLITVLSEKSGGKSSFTSLLLNNLDQQIKPVFMTAKVPCEKAVVLSDIAAQLHLNRDLNTSVSSIVAQINERKAPVLLVIDDAQHVAEELVKEFLLAIRGQQNSGFFHLCLVSDYSIVATLNNFGTEQFANFIHTIELGSLSESETRTYVLQRAMGAGLIHKPLSEQQQKQFYKLTKGSIAKINNELESFIFKYSTQSNNKSSGLVMKASFALSLVAALGFTIQYFNHSQVVEAPVAQQTYHDMKLPSIKEALNTASQMHLLASSSYLPPFRESAITLLVENELPKKQLLDIMDEEDKTNTVALVDKVIVIPSIPKNISHDLQEVASKIVHEHRLEVAHKVDKKTAQVKRELVSKVAQSSAYTIQVIASHKKEDVYRFKQTNKLYTNAKIRHFTNNKGSWYILTIGEYNTRALAQQKASQLPHFQGNLSPWVRSVSGLSNIG